MIGISYKYENVAPLDFRKNVEFRKKMVELGHRSSKDTKAIIAMCAEDPIFFINTFVWTYNPKNIGTEYPVVLPFISWEYQVVAFKKVFECMGVEDICVEKSRDMGASWIFLLSFFWCWMFRKDMAFLVTSRNQDYVDKVGDPDCLFWKLMFVLEKLPSWMQPKYEKTMNTLVNLSTKTVINGAPSTGELARGGRKSAIMIDEFSAFGINDGYRVLSSTRDATKSRFFNSTVSPNITAFSEVRKLKGMNKIVMHWTSHPHKRAGLYTSRDGVLEIIDTEYKFSTDYPFILDGKTRSPFYDKEESRCVNKLEIATELDIEEHVSGFQFFDVEMIERLKKETAMPPMISGNIEVDFLNGDFRGFSPNKDGLLHLWVPAGINQDPPPGEYVVGCDISTGSGATNSVASIVNRITDEKVGEYAFSGHKPSAFAAIAVALCKWFKNESGSPAKLIWEGNGPGGEFGLTVVRDIGFRNIFYRRNEQSNARKETDIPGWWSNEDLKRALLGEYRKALAAGKFINRSYAALGECLEYVQGSTGVYHSGSKATIDPTGARENHGDRVIADALANWFKSQVSSIVSEEEKKRLDPPNGSLAFFRNMEKRKKDLDRCRF